MAAILVLSCDEAARAAGGPLSGRKAVSYAGTTVEVPADWPVNDANRRAAYLYPV